MGGKISTNANWALEEGVKFLKEDLEEKEMWATDVLPLFKKEERVQPSLANIQNALLDLEKGLLIVAC